MTRTNSTNITGKSTFYPSKYLYAVNYCTTGKSYWKYPTGTSGTNAYDMEWFVLDSATTVYEHDDFGNYVSGNKNALIDAINSGKITVDKITENTPAVYKDITPQFHGSDVCIMLELYAAKFTNVGTFSVY
jgi:hypothetical protein